MKLLQENLIFHLCLFKISLAISFSIVYIKGRGTDLPNNPHCSLKLVASLYDLEKHWSIFNSSIVGFLLNPFLIIKTLDFRPTMNLLHEGIIHYVCINTTKMKNLLLLLFISVLISSCVTPKKTKAEKKIERVTKKFVRKTPKEDLKFMFGDDRIEVVVKYDTLNKKN